MIASCKRPIEVIPDLSDVEVAEKNKRTLRDAYQNRRAANSGRFWTYLKPLERKL